jgi:PKD repeat protein
MKKIIRYSFVALLLIGQKTHVIAQRSEKCATELEFQRQAKADPSLLIKRQEIEEIISRAADHASQQRSSFIPRIIPVVFHIIHEGGTENISREQCLSQLDVLNKDFRRLNADTVNTPAPFRTIAADCNIEFRIAQLDPNGSCTDGIIRKESYLTEECVPRDRVKAVSTWPRDKYLNIWVVKSIYQDDAAGIVLGYAQFPGMGASTDGVVIRSDRVGTIGTAVAANDQGRVTSHEVGHWLGLRHIWGDDGGTCNGTDYVTDTPNESDMIFGCPTFPFVDACTPSGNGVMFSNYMDYTDGPCQNIFTNGQKSRMDGNINAYRSNIVTIANNIATGTDGTVAVTCAPIAGFSIFNNHICAGDSVQMANACYNADTATLSYLWSFPGAVVTSSTAKNPWARYLTSGTKDISLTVTNSAGNNSITRTGVVIVSETIAALMPIFTDDLETAGTFPGTEGYILNNDNGNTWARITTVGYSGTACVKMNNFTGNQPGEVDSWATPSYDMTSILGAQLKFRVAYAQKDTSLHDYLKIYFSTTCGETWTLRNSKTGSTLASVTNLVTTAFTPANASQWRLETINCAAASGRANVRFKFEFVSGPGNNLYIDDINVTGTPNGMQEINSQSLQFGIYPNPASSSSFISFTLMQNADVDLAIYDVIGNEVKSVLNNNLETGIHGYHVNCEALSKGIYFVRLIAGETTAVQKLIVE